MIYQQKAVEYKAQNIMTINRQNNVFALSNIMSLATGLYDDRFFQMLFPLYGKNIAALKKMIKNHTTKSKMFYYNKQLIAIRN